MDKRANPRKRACDSCYKRKIQCDRDEPQCNWCKHHGLACTFNRPARVKKAAKKNKKGGEENNLSERIGRLEQLLAEKVTNLSPEPSEQASDFQDDLSLPLSHAGSTPGSASEAAPSDQLATGNFGKLHFAGHHLGEISSQVGIPLFSADGQKWLQSRTGERAAFPVLAAPLWHNQHRTHQDIILPLTHFDLPDRQVTEEYLSIFSSSHIRYVFPIVDAVLFRHTIDAAYSTSGNVSFLETTKSKSCIFSFLAVASLMSGKLDATPIDSEACAVKAQYLFPQAMLDPSVTALQIMFMQCMYHLFSGKFQMASMFHSVACRLLYMLGAHTQVNDLASTKPPTDGTEMEWRIRNHLRKYFWLCYTFDKDLALRTGHPPAIEDEHCDLNLPRGYHAGQIGKMRVDDDGTPFLPGDLFLSMIKSKAIKLLYSTEALRKSDAELLRAIRELDDELESWRMTIDPRFRPTLSCREDDFDVEPTANITQKMHHIVTNFEYHYLMATIHQATSRCRAWANGASGEMDGVSSSLALSVEASRSTLVYLRVAVQEMVGESFWMVVFYPMSAILTIFCNILLNPLCPRAEGDLELLNSTPELIRGIRFRRLTLNEVMHIKMIEDFVAELIRLGACAIRKAHQDEMG
ncbi:hypothetical protein JX265_006652 [Neoarthrinium moseri]|uniref:Zn(2)-C6 fungal-type domain-containing protein n=1 Tax=Neoarthrinium moseri TaxID=1658444 RepID=A0A9P9WLD5_9PEZI|nr:hypothetical protein JX266_000071 [Neoarthrinium moseri]KAI1869562.1 hypothetical protein JX265_006652 [Neoarthrinium moseri]